MPMQYPVLDYPIDQWKVLELKEELHRWKITTKGLKEDLLKRLDEAIRSEADSISEGLGNGFNLDANCQVKCSDMVEVAMDENKSDEVDDDANEVDNDKSNIKAGQGIIVEDGESVGNINSDMVVEETVVLAVSTKSRVTDSQSVLTQLESSGQESGNEETQMGNEGSKPPLEGVELCMSVSTESKVADSQSVLTQLEASGKEPGNEETQMGNESSRPSLEDVELSVSDHNNQIKKQSTSANPQSDSAGGIWNSTKPPTYKPLMSPLQAYLGMHFTQPQNGSSPGLSQHLMMIMCQRSVLFHHHREVQRLP